MTPDPELLRTMFHRHYGGNYSVAQAAAWCLIRARIQGNTAAYENVLKAIRLFNV
jgi:hypothetical protein